jgi:DNA-binding NarL/FixJ family response regulator
MERTAASLGPILVADGDAARRSFIRNAFGRSFELVEIEAKGDIGVLEKTAPVLGVVGRLWPQFPAPIEIAGTMREACPATPVVLIGDPSSEELAIAALRVGVRDYLSAPVTGPQLIGSMSHLMPGVCCGVSG